MRTNRRAMLFIPFLLLVLLACQFTGTATPSGTSSPFNSTAAPQAQANTYSSPENGVSVLYPNGWTTQPPPAGDSGLVLFLSPDQSVQAELFVQPTQSGDTPQTVTTQVAGSALNGLQNINILSDAALKLNDSLPAWMQVVGATTSNGTQIKVGLISILSGGRAIVLLAFGQPSSFDGASNDLNTLANGVSFTAVVVNGVNRDQALFLSGGESTNPRDYDPATEHDSGDKRIYDGLVTLDAKLNLTPDLAASWDISGGGTLYTFHLRPNAKFQDGRPVTAQDVIYSWERAANPVTQSDTVLTYLGDILGVADMHSGKAQHISGLKVLDDHTLQVTIDAPKQYFLYELTMPVAFVLDKKNVESGANWYRTPNGTGPYKLTRWDTFKLMVYTANPDYFLGAPSIPQIVVELNTGVGINLYESGNIDMTGISTTDVSRVLDPSDPLHPDVHSGVSLCTSYVVFDTTKPPFDDLKVRQAFTEAFDRQEFINVVDNGVGIPAAGLYPPALPGYDVNLKGLPFDPQQARQLLAQSKYGGPQGLPPIIFSAAGFGNSASPDVAAMAQMWEQNLGVKITIDNLEPDRYFDLVYSGKHGQLISSNWCADYPDPQDFADVLFHTGAQQNTGNYSNPALDTVLDQARAEPDVTKRIQLYQQAEQLIVQDAPALFLEHDLMFELVKPYVKGFVLTPIDIPLERYLSIQH